MSSDPLEKIVTRPLDPIIVPVISSLSTGTGDGNPIQDKTVLKTPDRQPDVRIHIVSTTMAVVVRFLNGYATTLVGLVTAGMTSNAIPASDFADLLLKCAALSIAGPALGAIKDVITILTKLEAKYPLLTGNV